MTTSTPRALTRRSFLASGAAALTAPLLGACEDGPTSDIGFGNPRLTVRPTTPSLAAPAGQTALGIGGTRDAFLYVPAGYDPQTPTPMFVALHGATRSSADWTFLFPELDARGYLMLAIDSREFTWDLAIHSAFGADVPFIDQALAWAFERCNVEPTRLALGGFSDGASYSLAVGTANGDLFSHIISFSPGFAGPGAVLVGRPRIFISHGTSDTILPVSVTANEIVPLLRGSGYDVTYDEFQGGHDLPSEIRTAAFDWFET